MAPEERLTDEAWRAVRSALQVAQHGPENAEVRFIDALRTFGFEVVDSAPPVSLDGLERARVRLREASVSEGTIALALAIVRDELLAACPCGCCDEDRNRREHGRESLGCHCSNHPEAEWCNCGFCLAAIQSQPDRERLDVARRGERAGSLTPEDRRGQGRGWRLGRGSKSV